MDHSGGNFAFSGLAGKLFLYLVKLGKESSPRPDLTVGAVTSHVVSEGEPAWRHELCNHAAHFPRAEIEETEIVHIVAQ